MENNYRTVPVIVPSLDPDEKLHEVVEGLLREGFSDIVLVNDGSHAERIHYFDDEVAAHPDKVTLLTHEINRGKGAAMKTAFRYLMENRPALAGVVTVDGDNQHRPEDTRRCVERMLESGHTVLGVRDFNLPDVPKRSRFGNHLTSFVFKLLVGMKISDTQTGLRALPADTLPTMVKVKGDRYEYETNTLLSLQEHSLPFDEVKIQTVYIEENQSSHFHVFRDSFRIYKLLLGHFVRYTMSSLLCALVDTGLYALMGFLLIHSLVDPYLSAVCTVVARLCSSLLNLFLNKYFVFRTRGNAVRSALRYYALALPIMLMQFLLTEGCYRLFGIGEGETWLRTLVYAIVMVILFILSYIIQQRWVFKNQPPKAKK